MLKTDYESKVDEIIQNRFSDFDPIQDIEPLVMRENWCMIRTRKLMPTLWFMQDAGRKIWELTSDDEYISWIKFEANILTYYKPKHLIPNQSWKCST